MCVRHVAANGRSTRAAYCLPRCQHLCAALPTCDFFSYEYELLDADANDGVYAHECYLKAAYDGCTADDDDPMAGYAPWSSDDPGWVGHSGPEVCPGAQKAAPDRSCLLTGMDYGGSPHDCGYADTIIIYSDSSAFPTPGWYSGPVMYNTLLADAGACQDLCEATPGYPRSGSNLGLAGQAELLP